MQKNNLHLGCSGGNPALETDDEKLTHGTINATHSNMTNQTTCVYIGAKSESREKCIARILVLPFPESTYKRETSPAVCPT
jgi:hypothetical protein